MKRPELLAPAGSMESLYAAIMGGANAIYLAGQLYGARSFAANFNEEELKEAINLAHSYDVKIYVTINTLIYEAEVPNFMKYVDYLVSIGCDAVIMQDIGMLDLVHKTYPDLEIHASTQMHIHNLEGAKLVEQLGVKRVVLARETPIELVKEIIDNTNLEIEIFIHGALCLSYSGQCLMSSLIGGRSGNRGTCAQCCRQPYKLEIDGKKVNKDEYLLSTKDLNTLEYIGELIKIGVHSLKIEGRMKRPEYVYYVTNTYNKYINEYLEKGKVEVKEEDIVGLKKLFNRGFTKGFLFHEENNKFTNPYRPNHMGIVIGEVIDYNKGYMKIKLVDEVSKGDGIRIIDGNDTGLTITNLFKKREKIDIGCKGDIIDIPIDEKVRVGSLVVKTTDIKQLKEIEEKMKNKRKVNIEGECNAYIGSNLELCVICKDIIVTLKSDYIVEEAKNSGTTKERIEEQLNKLGDTVYRFNALKINTSDNVFIPIQKINELRRDVLIELDKRRLERKVLEKKEYYIDVPSFSRTSNKSILVHTSEEVLKYYSKYDVIYIDSIEEYNKVSDKCILKLSRVLEHLKEYDNKLLVGELGSVYKYKNVDADFSLNVVNSYAVALLHSLGVNKVTLSIELNEHQIKNIVNKYQERYGVLPNLEVIVSGHVESMITKYRLLEPYNSNNGYLIDKYNNHFRVLEKDNLTYIYHYEKLNLKGDYYALGINSTRDNLD